MSKKMMKRSLALGALMAFVITGSAWAADVNVADGNTVSYENLTLNSDENFTNAGTLNVTGAINLNGGDFSNTGIINTDVLDITTNNSPKPTIAGTINATTRIEYHGTPGANCYGVNLDAVLCTPLLKIIGNNNETGLVVKNSTVLKDVGAIIVESSGKKTGLIIDQNSEVNLTAPITLSGTGNDARIELYFGAEFNASKITSNAEKALLQINGVGEIKVDELIVESGAVNMQANGANNGYTGETGTITYNLNKITVADGASLRAVAWQNEQPNIDITGNLNIDLGAGSTVDFGGVTNSDWRDKHIDVKADSMTVNVAGVENADDIGNVYISKNSTIEDGKITVISDAANNTGEAEADLKKIAGVVQRTSKTDYTSNLGDTNSTKEIAAGVNLFQEASSIFDAASGTVSADGIVENIQTTKNSNVFGITENNALSLMSWRAEMNDMNKRMGELRNAEGQHGVWVRMVRGEAEYESVKNQYNQYQMGYDEKLSVDPSWTVGAAFNYTEGDTAYSTGSAENKNVGFSIYGSKLNDDGSFIDLIAKYARLENDFETTIGDGDYSSNGYSVSAEYGKRFTKENGLWIEPQVELTYGKVGSADYKMGTVDVAQDSIESLVGRVGFSLGKNISKGNVYARASYLYDFDGETNVNFVDGGKPRNIEQDLGGGWWEVGVGANINLSKATYIYADIEKTFGGEVDTNWQWNLGVRYSF